MKNKHLGIYPRESSITIYFTWEGKSYRPTLELPPTPKNLEYAAKMRKDILRRIELGTFSMGEFFPKSKHAEQNDLGPGITDAVDQYLGYKARTIAITTLREYRNTLYSTLVDHHSMLRIGEITFGLLDGILQGSTYSGKTYNNVTSCWRGLFEYALKQKWITDNPANHFEKARVSQPAPDPLDRGEMEAVIADMAQHYPEQVANYFEAALWLGWRPSEGIAMEWSAIDWNKRLLRITDAKVRGMSKDTKTHRSRDVELDDRAIAIFKRQKEYTFLQGGAIFRNPVTGDPWYDTSDLVQKYWRPSLKRLGIRDRDARQTRHTCATMLLMADCNPAWCAGQLGHSVEMFFRVYARWIAGADRGRERAKLNDGKSEKVETK